MQLRLVLVGLGVVLGVFLVAQGAVVVGGLVLVMAAVRLAMVVRFGQLRHERMARRDEFRDRLRARRYSDR